jgi:hypothetical protein
VDADAEGVQALVAKGAEVLNVEVDVEVDVDADADVEGPPSRVVRQSHDILLPALIH